MSKHTLGPWQYTFEGGTVAYIVEADGTTVVKLSTTENSTAHSHLPANVRLIAAAPDLLKKLEKLLQIVENNWLDQEWEPDEWECYEEFRQVISEAKGGA